MQSSSIKVGNRTYAIALVNDNDFDALLSNLNQLDYDVKSFVDYDEQLIVVRSRLRPDHQRELIVHEVLHACIEDSGTMIDRELIESVVSLMAPRLSTLIEDLVTVLKA